MRTTQDVPVAEIAANSPAAVRVFERLGIDYCCGGKRPLAEVCREKGHDLAAVISELESAMRDTPPAARDWSAAPLRELIDHIVATHHAYLRRELGPLGERLNKVYRVYNLNPAHSGLLGMAGRPVKCRSGRNSDTLILTSLLVTESRIIQ